MVATTIFLMPPFDVIHKVSKKAVTSWFLKAIITGVYDGCWNSVGMLWVIRSNRWCTCCKIANSQLQYDSPVFSITDYG